MSPYDYDEEFDPEAYEQWAMDGAADQEADQEWKQALGQLNAGPQAFDARSGAPIRFPVEARAPLGWRGFQSKQK